MARRSERSGDPPGGFDLELVALAIPKRQRVDLEPLSLGERERSGRVYPTTQEHDALRLGIRHGAVDRRGSTGRVAGDVITLPKIHE